MLDSLKKYFGKKTEDDSGKDPSHDVKVAACALLLEIANIDDEFSKQELSEIIEILQRDFGLNKEQADSMMEDAQNELKHSVDLWQFTSLINKNYSRQEKKEVIEMVWQVVYADGVLDKHEDYLVRKLATLLNLRHEDFIEAKLKVKKRA